MLQLFLAKHENGDIVYFFKVQTFSKYIHRDFPVRGNELFTMLIRIRKL